jgi:hypothetical protein
MKITLRIMDDEGLKQTLSFDSKDRVPIPNIGDAVRAGALHPQKINDRLFTYANGNLEITLVCE